MQGHDGATNVKALEKQLDAARSRNRELEKKASNAAVVANDGGEDDLDVEVERKYSEQPDGWNVTSMMIDHHRQAKSQSAPSA